MPPPISTVHIMTSPLHELFNVMLKVAQALRLADFLPAPPEGRLLVLGAGKAAALMARQTEAHYAALAHKIEGFVVVPYGYGEKTEHIKVIEASHPVPNTASRDVGLLMLKAVGELTARDRLLMLMSGGASSLLVAPRQGLTLDDKRAATKELLRNGLPISLVNSVRKRLSAIKGGRLALVAAPAPVTTLVLSDIPGDDPADVGSGPTVADPTSTAEILHAIESKGVELSQSVRAMLASPEAETPFPGDPRLPPLDIHVVLTAKECLDAVEHKACSLGFDVVNLGDQVEGEARHVAEEQAELTRRLQDGLMSGDKPILILSGGETSVTVHGSGQGGRNSEYLLALALALEGRPFEALAVDTDGIDGMGRNAGAYINTSLLEEARTSGIDLGAALADNDSLTVFTALHSLIFTGPTRTNVNDFRAILLYPHSLERAGMPRGK